MMPLNVRSFLRSQSNELNTGCLSACLLVPDPTSEFLASMPNGPNTSGCRLSDMFCARSGSCECKFHDVVCVSVSSTGPSLTTRPSSSTGPSLNQLKSISEKVAQKFTGKELSSTYLQ